MVDVGWYDGVSGSYLGAHELGGDVCLDAQLLAVHVFAYGYVFHLGRYDACLGTAHLCRALAGRAAAVYPRLADALYSFSEVCLHVRVRERAARVVDVDRCIGFDVPLAVGINGHGGGEVHLNHSYTEVGIYFPCHVELLALGVFLVVLWHCSVSDS